MSSLSPIPQPDEERNTATPGFPAGRPASSETGPERLRRWSGELANAAVMCFMPTTTRFGKLYDSVFGLKNLLGEESMYINFGYWKNNPHTLDDACADLARLLGAEARLGPEDSVVDVGCGYGDQDLLWAREFGVASIVGVNVTQNQITVANARAQDGGLAERVSFEYGSASALPRPDESVTKVTALESAFHFPSRPEFFGEAYRVLKPGGRLAIADMVPLRRDEVAVTAAAHRPVGAIARAMFTADRSHPVTVHTYPNLLQEAGFKNVRVHTIRHHVYAPFAEFIRRRFAEPDMKRVNPVGRLFFGPTGMALWAPWLDYVVLVADKPG